MRTSRTMFPMAGAVLTAAIMLTSCGGGDKQPAPEAATTTPSVESTTPSGPQTPDPGGKIITVLLITDETGNYFKPKEIDARQGDVVRYTVGMGVHNVDFLPDSNAGKSGLPKTSDMLQLPGQTFDVKVTLAPGKYFFQCTPHAALGMHGHLQVAAK